MLRLICPEVKEQPEWYALVDFAPEQIMSTRCRLLDRPVADKALVLALHFPFPALGHVVPEGEGGSSNLLRQGTRASPRPFPGRPT